MDYGNFVIGVIFWLLAALILFSGLMVVIVKNIIHSALWLIGSFAAVAALYFLLEAPFIGVVQVLVYAGAISILVLFAIMLTRQVTGEGTRQLFERWWVAALVAIALFAGVIVPAVWSPQLPQAEPGQPTYWPQTDLAQASAAASPAAEPLPEDAVAPATAPLAGAYEIGRSFMGEYLLPFEVSSLLLLVALIGAIVIAYEERTRRRRILTWPKKPSCVARSAGCGEPRQALGRGGAERSDAGPAEPR